MPLTKKGRKVMRAMKAEYGAEKGEQVFYASKNAGRIKGVDRGFFGHCDPNELRTHQIRTTGGGVM